LEEKSRLVYTGSSLKEAVSVARGHAFWVFVFSIVAAALNAQTEGDISKAASSPGAFIETVESMRGRSSVDEKFLARLCTTFRAHGNTLSDDSIAIERVERVAEWLLSQPKMTTPIAGAAVKLLGWARKRWRAETIALVALRSAKLRKDGFNAKARELESWAKPRHGSDEVGQLSRELEMAPVSDSFPASYIALQFYSEAPWTYQGDFISNENAILALRSILQFQLKKGTEPSPLEPSKVRSKTQPWFWGALVELGREQSDVGTWVHEEVRRYWMENRDSTWGRSQRVHYPSLCSELESAQTIAPAAPLPPAEAQSGASTVERIAAWRSAQEDFLKDKQNPHMKVLLQGSDRDKKRILGIYAGKQVPVELFLAALGLVWDANGVVVKDAAIMLLSLPISQQRLEARLVKEVFLIWKDMAFVKDADKAVFEVFSKWYQDTAFGIQILLELNKPEIKEQIRRILNRATPSALTRDERSSLGIAIASKRESESADTKWGKTLGDLEERLEKVTCVEAIVDKG
jgi:hypothetical protein